ncbi:4Fe-4S binding protein [Peptostreptococcus faecalis]|uniref:4Fe-4S binding protein n=1 Tax=Peptostreptococcus faecalis TaxID=2045015 RepID=UPI000C7A2F3D
MVLSNLNFKGFASSRIYKGDFKQVCVPGLNCYSCPGAVGGCPIGSLQAVISDIKYKFSFYIVGFLTLIGVVLGRFVCGWLCPFGLIQELLYKIPFVKKDIFKKFDFLKYLKYFILVVFVIIIPMFWVNEAGSGGPAFCKYICPAGTLEAGIPMVILNEGLRQSIGFLYNWKMFILIVTILLSIITYRPFCKYICPLGAIYGLFNKISFYRLNVDSNKCINCKKCVKVCKMNVEPYKNPNSAECIRCGECVDECPIGALEKTFIKKENIIDLNKKSEKYKEVDLKEYSKKNKKQEAEN